MSLKPVVGESIDIHEIDWSKCPLCEKGLERRPVQEPHCTGATHQHFHVTMKGRVRYRGPCMINGPLPNAT